MARTPIRNKRRAAALGAAAALFLACAPRARAAQAPSADELLDAVVDPPEVAYQGRLLLVHWFGKHSRAEEVAIYRLPPDKTRRDFLSPDGSSQRIIVDNGDHEQVRLPRQRKILEGDAAKTYEKVMPAETERQLLEKNYQMSVSGPQKVAGRPAWVLELKPNMPGKPWQRFWLDAETKIILENKRFLPGKRFAELSRFTRFQKTSPPEELFSLDVASGTRIEAQGLAPDFMSLQQLNEATGSAMSFPSSLPGGFEFESADFMRLRGRTVRHVRYTDGLAIVSIFETDKPVLLPKQGTKIVYNPSTGPSALRLVSVGEVLNWKRGRKHYTVMSDVSRELLLAIESQLK